MFSHITYQPAKKRIELSYVLVVDIQVQNPVHQELCDYREGQFPNTSILELALGAAAQWKKDCLGTEKY